MLFRVLGPLEVRAGSGWTAIGAPKLRAVLAALVLAHGEVVSTERLVEELWGTQPPPRARKQVSKYVHELRGLAGDPDGRMLVTRSPGYQLLIAPEQVDAGRFEEAAGGRPARRWRMVTRGRRGSCCVRGWRCGADRRWPTCPPACWSRRRQTGWTSCGWSRWNYGSKLTWRPAARPPAWRRSCGRCWRTTRCGSGCGTS